MSNFNFIPSQWKHLSEAPREALHSLKLLYGFVVWLVQEYGED